MHAYTCIPPPRMSPGWLVCNPLSPPPRLSILDSLHIPSPLALPHNSVPTNMQTITRPSTRIHIPWPALDGLHNPSPPSGLSSPTLCKSSPVTVAIVQPSAACIHPLLGCYVKLAIPGSLGGLQLITHLSPLRRPLTRCIQPPTCRSRCTSLWDHYCIGPEVQTSALCISPSTHPHCSTLDSLHTTIVARTWVFLGQYIYTTHHRTVTPFYFLDHIQRFATPHPSLTAGTSDNVHTSPELQRLGNLVVFKNSSIVVSLCFLDHLRCCATPHPFLMAGGIVPPSENVHTSPGLQRLGSLVVFKNLSVVPLCSLDHPRCCATHHPSLRLGPSFLPRILCIHHQSLEVATTETWRFGSIQKFDHRLGFLPVPVSPPVCVICKLLSFNQPVFLGGFLAVIGLGAECRA